MKIGAFFLAVLLGGCAISPFESSTYWAVHEGASNVTTISHIRGESASRCAEPGYKSVMAAGRDDFRIELASMSNIGLLDKDADRVSKIIESTMRWIDGVPAIRAVPLELRVNFVDGKCSYYRKARHDKGKYRVIDVYYPAGHDISWMQVIEGVGVAIHEALHLFQVEGLARDRKEYEAYMGEMCWKFYVAPTGVQYSLSLSTSDLSRRSDRVDISVKSEREVNYVVSNWVGANVVNINEENRRVLSGRCGHLINEYFSGWRAHGP